MVAILAPLQRLFGDQHGLNTLEHQRIKIAAMEGHWEDSGVSSARSWEASAALAAQKFIFVGIAILLPFILGYTAFACYTFRGRLREGEGYH